MSKHVLISRRLGVKSLCSIEVPGQHSGIKKNTPTPPYTPLARLEKNKLISIPHIGRAVAQAVSRWLPTAAARVRVRADMWGLWWTKRHWGRFSPITSASPANHHSANFSIIIITRGWHNRPISGRNAEWTQLDSTPHYTNYNFFLISITGTMIINDRCKNTC
jgi:hypothetical protein